MPYRDSEKQKAYKKEWARMKREGEAGTPCGTGLPLEFRLKTAQDVLNLLQDQVNAVIADEEVGTLERARCVGYLASVALRAVESANLEGRLTALEETLKSRGRSKTA